MITVITRNYGQAERLTANVALVYTHATSTFLKTLFPSEPLEDIKVIIDINKSTQPNDEYASITWIDDIECPLKYAVKLRKTSLRGSLIYLAHEIVHLGQMYSGTFISNGDIVHWHGRKYKLTDSDKHGINNAFLPWEIEANGLEFALFNHFKSIYNITEKDLRSFDATYGKISLDPIRAQLKVITNTQRAISTISPRCSE